MGKYIVCLDSVCKIYSKGIFHRQRVEAVMNVSLTIDEGETFCLIGPNGAGKTTLVRLLMNFTKPTLGSVNLFGQPHTNIDLHNSIGYFPEKGKYPPRLTIQQFLFHWGRFSGLSGSVLQIRIDELLRFVKLEEKRNAYIKTLSKGMTVRLGLAQALLNDPALLVLDEPTDGLDPLGRVEFRDMLKELKNQGKTIFVNSHLLSEVEQISTRIGFMKKGNIIKIDRMDNLLTEKRTMKIFFQCSTPETIADLRRKFDMMFDEGMWNITLHEGQDLNESIKELSGQGAVIHGIEENKGVLEQEFLKMMKDQS